MNNTVTLFYCENPKKTSHELLRHTASLLTGLSPEEFHTKKAPQGKPYFPQHPELHFSISHSGNLWICVFSDTEIGCDIQFHTTPKRMDAIVARYFHPNELSVYENAPDRLTAFHRIWCRKEAAVKRTGHGIDRTFAETDTTSHDCGVYDVSLPFSGYSCAVACPSSFRPTIQSLL